MSNATPRRRSLFGTMLRASLHARRGRLALAVGAIAIGTSVAAALLLVSVDVDRKVERELRAYGPNLVLAPAAGELVVGERELKVGSLGGEPQFGPAAAKWLEREQLAGRVVSQATLRYAVARVGHQAIVVAGTKTPIFTFGMYQPARIRRTSRPYVGGTVIVDPKQSFVGSKLADRLGIAADSPLTIAVKTRDGERELALGPVGVFETGRPEDALLLVPSSVLDSALGDPGRFHIALARAQGSSKSVLAYAATAAATAPAGALPLGASLRAVKRLTEADGQMLERIRLLLVLVTIVALVAAALCAMSTLADLVLERTPEIALLRSLGAGRGDLLRLFLGEAAVLGFVGAIAGLAIGLVAAQAIGFGVFGSSIRPTPIVLPVTLALGVLTALVAAIAPVRDALRVEPARVLRGE